MSRKIDTNYDWINEHNNIRKTVLKRYEISNDPGAANWKSGFVGIQQMLKEAWASNERVRSYGGKWSLSDVAICGDIVHNTKPLTFFAPIGKSMIAGKAIYDVEMPLEKRLYFVQCGLQIVQLNTVLEQKGLILPTTGASNGQTIAGAISTGTHGSALRIGAMPDFVRAIHLVTNENDHFIVQPKTNTGLNSNFAAHFGAKEIIDDDIFNSTLVSFGSFGVIHGYVLELMPLCILDSSLDLFDYNKAEALFPLLEQFDPNDTTPITDYLKGLNISSEGELHQVDFTINPYADKNNVYIRGMFKVPYDEAKLTPIDPAKTKIGDDIVMILGKFSGHTRDIIPYLMNNVLFSSAQDIVHNFKQTPRNTFGDSTFPKTQDGNTSSEIGTSIASASKAVAIAMREMKQAQIPGFMGVRFIKPTKATVGFTRFAPLTCAIEILAVNNQTTYDGYRLIYDALDDANIPFTLHWGQAGDFSPYRLQKMYGSALGKWIKNREKVLPDPKQRYMFTNDFMKRCGLDEPMPITPGAPIV